MHRLKTSFLLFCFIISAGHFAAADGKEASMETAEECSAVVTDNNAVFVFPIEKTQRWTWYRDKTSDNRLEYSWELSLDENKPEYIFGVYLLKFPGASQKKGSLKDLLRYAQFSVVERSCHAKGVTLTVRPDLMIRALTKGDHIIIEVKDKNTLDTLFQHKPPKAFFRVIKPDEQAASCEVLIEYKE